VNGMVQGFLIVLDAGEHGVCCRACRWQDCGYPTLRQAVEAFDGHRCRASEPLGLEPGTTDAPGVAAGGASGPSRPGLGTSIHAPKPRPSNSPVEPMPRIVDPPRRVVDNPDRLPASTDGGTRQGAGR
jgi:hypothetical protein